MEQCTLCTEYSVLVVRAMDVSAKTAVLAKLSPDDGRLPSRKKARTSKGKLWGRGGGERGEERNWYVGEVGHRPIVSSSSTGTQRGAVGCRIGHENGIASSWDWPGGVALDPALPIVSGKVGIVRLGIARGNPCDCLVRSSPKFTAAVRHRRLLLFRIGTPEPGGERYLLVCMYSVSAPWDTF